MDTAIAWLASPEKKWVMIERTAMYLFLFIVYVVTDLFLRPGIVRYLGIALVIAVPYCLLVRLGHTFASLESKKRRMAE